MATASIFQMAALFKLAHYQIARKEASFPDRHRSGPSLPSRFLPLRSDLARRLDARRIAADQCGSATGRHIDRSALDHLRQRILLVELREILGRAAESAI